MRFWGDVPVTDRPRLVLLGVPWDASSSYLRGAAAGPPAIREALWSPSTNSSTELGIVVEPSTLDDAGDLSLPANDPAAARVAIEDAVRAIRESGGVPIVLGGDHSITYPVLRAYRESVPASVLHLDAHGDLYDSFPAFALPRFGAAGSAFAPPRFAEAGAHPGDTADGSAATAPSRDRLGDHLAGTDSAGASPGPAVRLREVPGVVDRYSHACPFARVMEDRLTGRLVQVGIRTATAHLRAQAVRFGVQVYGMERWRDAPVEALQGPLYVSLDLDGLDPAFAPGVAHPEPGGLSTREVVDLLHRIRAPIAGADIVELNPSQDVRDLTARVAAKLLKELVAVAVRNHARR